jgi:hypothetical protein
MNNWAICLQILFILNVLLIHSESKISTITLNESAKKRNQTLYTQLNSWGEETDEGQNLKIIPKSKAKGKVKLNNSFSNGIMAFLHSDIAKVLNKYYIHKAYKVKNYKLKDMHADGIR